MENAYNKAKLKANKTGHWLILCARFGKIRNAWNAQINLFLTNKEFA